MFNLRRSGIAVWIVAALCVGLPASASGAVTVGQTGNTGSNCAGSGYTLVQDTVAAAPTYVMPAHGVITSWSHSAGSGAVEMRLKVYRRTGVIDRLLAVGHSPLEAPAPNGLRTFGARVKVAAGDLLGLSILSSTGTFACIFGTAAAGDRTRQAAGDPTLGSPLVGPFNDSVLSRVNVSAQLEPDADADGFGDETQDQCPTDSAEQADCTAPRTTITEKPERRIKTRKRAAKVRVSFESEAGATFECKLDRHAFRRCESPFKVRARAKPGKGKKHRIRIKATDQAGNVESKAATVRFRVIRKRKAR